MTAELTTILDAALRLPDADRAALAERLWKSLDDGDGEDDEGDFGDHPFAAEWDEEIRQRLEDARTGKVKSVPWEEVRKLLQEDRDGAAG